MKVCIVPGCPVLTQSTRCPEHTRERDRVRGSSTARGYGARHRSERELWAPLVASGAVRCARCRERINPGDPWDYDHRDDRSGYLGPSHASCNRATAGRERKTS